MDGIDYVLADINCRLNVKFNDGKFRVFNSETELANIISIVPQLSKCLKFEAVWGVLTDQKS